MTQNATINTAFVNTRAATYIAARNTCCDAVTPESENEALVITTSNVAEKIIFSNFILQGSDAATYDASVPKTKKRKK